MILGYDFAYRYYSFPYHKAPPKYLLRKTAAQLLGGEVPGQIRASSSEVALS